MHFLQLFQKFDAKEFFGNKVIKCINCVPWNDYNTKEHRGTKVNCIIIKDGTDYHGKEGSNRYEKLTFKVPKDIVIPEEAYVAPVNPVAKVYGEYNNMLSIICDDVTIIKKEVSK